MSVSFLPYFQTVLTKYMETSINYQSGSGNSVL